MCVWHSGVPIALVPAGTRCSEWARTHACAYVHPHALRARAACCARAQVFARRWQQAVKHRSTKAEQLLVATGNCVRDPVTNAYCVAPAPGGDGRITIVGARGGDGAGDAGSPAPGREQQQQQQQQP